MCVLVSVHEGNAGGGGYKSGGGGGGGGIMYMCASCGF